MATTEGLTSIHGRRLGLDRAGNLVTDRGDGNGVNLMRWVDLMRWTAYANTAAAAAISNTASETEFSTGYTIPANTLFPGEVIDIYWQGIATATNGTDTLAIKVYLGGMLGTLLFTHAATDVADNNVFSGWYKLIVRSVGSRGTVVGFGHGKSVPAAEGTMTAKDDILASTKLNTTIPQLISVSATWSNASSSNSCRLDVLHVMRG